MMQTEPYLLALVVLAAPLVGCIGDTGSTAPSDVPMGTIDQGPHSDIQDQRIEIVHDASAWAALWTEHAGEDEPAPGVSFDEHVVVAAFMGQRPNACHAAKIENATRTADGIQVSGAWIERTGGVCAEMLTAPFHIVSLEADTDAITAHMENRTQPVGNGSDGGEGIQDGGSPGQAPGAGDDGNASFETIDLGSMSGIEDPRNVVVRTQDAWEALWANHTREGNQTPPSVAFDEHTVVALFKGQSPNTCHAIKVNGTTWSGDDVTVHATERTGDGMACGMQMTYPFHIVELDRVPDEVSFETTTQQG